MHIFILDFLPAVDAGNYASRPVDNYYLSGLIRARINVDNTVLNGYDASVNPHPYALADNYNNAMRFPDEQAYFNLRVAAGDEDVDEPTYRLLLEDMFQNPSNYRNSIFINLHGELFPFPPVRNYSDAAKAPETFTWAEGAPRAVTHPENLRYTNTDPLVLRVYSYLANPAGTLNWLTTAPVTVLLKNISWTPASGEVKAIEGGTDQDGVGGADTYVVNNALNGPSGDRMYYTVSTVGADTLISLFKSPLRTPQIGNTGLATTNRLYGMDYIPSPLEDFVNPGPPASIFEGPGRS